jgi:tripeptidyl-peptidase-1
MMDTSFYSKFTMLSIHLSVFVLLTLLLEDVTAVPTWSNEIYKVKERHTVPQGWTRIASPPDSHLIHLRIGLRPRNPGLLQQHAVEVSDPSHARYGQYLSATEIKNFAAPSEQSIDMVQSWLLNHDIETTALNPTGDWINVHLPVRKAETLLNTTYSVYAHNDGSTLVRAPEWSLPENLHQHIDLVQPTTSFFRAAKQTVHTKPERGPIDWHQPHDRQWWKAAPNHVGSGNAVFSLERSDQDDDCSIRTSQLVISAQCAM